MSALLPHDASAQGEALPATRPVLLNGHGGGWLVAAGAVDIFHVALDAQGVPGARRHLHRVGAGAVVLGLDLPPPQSSALLAVGLAQTRWHRFDGAQAAQGGSEPGRMRALIHDWLGALARAAGMAEAADIPDVPDASGLRDFHARLLAQCERQRVAEQERLRQSLAARQAAESNLFSHAIAGLGRILSPGAASLAGVGADALMQAWDLVLQAQGLARHAPVVGGPGRGADPLVRIQAWCDQANLAYRRVSLRDRDWWRSECGPLLGFRRSDGAALALLPERGGYRLVDPAGGAGPRIGKAEAEQLAEHAFGFYPRLPQQPLGLPALLRFCLRGSAGDGRRLLGFGVLGGLLALATPVAIGVLFDAIIPGADRWQLLQMVALLCCAALCAAAFELCRGIALMRVDGRVGSAAQSALVLRLLQLPAPFFRRYAAGDLAQRVGALENILLQLRGTVESAVFSWMFGMFSFAYLFFIDTGLALLAAVLVAISLALGTVLNWRRIRQERAAQQIQGVLASRILQFLNGIGKLRANGAEKRAFALWAQDFGRQKALGYRAARSARALLAFDAAYLVLCPLLLYAAVAGSASTLAPGAFLAFAAAFAQFLGATLAMSAALTASVNAIPLYERILPILHTLPETDARQAAPGQLSGALEVNRLCFRYHPDAPLALDELSLKITPGQFVAFVGPSGSGKSTLLRLLLGFEKPQAGGIYYDGQDLSGLDVLALRRQFGVVLQDGKLMPGDIFGNIAGAAPLSLEQAWAAARIAGLEQDIRAMPMGMHTVISEGAGTLSGGQKQRILIARAVARQPRIMLLDEATSALDNPTQQQVATGIGRLRATRIVIAHRLSTIADADRIFVLDKGKLVESGNYRELMDMGGKFCELARRQRA